MSKSVDLPAWMKNYVKPRPNLKELRSITKTAKPDNCFSDADTVTTCDKFWQCAESCEHILQKAETDELVLGLDIDWMRDYKTVLARTSNIHVCSQPNKCYIFDVYSMKALPRAFTLLLRHPNVHLVGYHIINDLRKLGRDFQIDLQPLIEKIEYPSKYSEHTLYCTHGWNLKNVISKGLDLVIRDLSQNSQQQNVLKFPGQVILCKTFSEIGEISDLLLREAEILDDKFILGFDLEWPFNFKAGSGKVALIQICPNQHICYLFHLLEMTSLPKALVLLLKHSNVKLSGLNIANDIRKLGRDFRIDVKSILENNLIELTSFANKKLNTCERWSLDRLVLNQLQLILEKPMNVRVSNWSKEHLSKEQTIYAATDAYALKIQSRIATVLKEGSFPYRGGALLLLEHPSVYTVGLRKGGYTEEDAERLKRTGAEFVQTDRGGLITFHGPGQLVAWPLLRLKHFKPSVRWYVDTIESTVIHLCHNYGLSAQRSPHTGVWIDDSKICAIGVHASRFVTTHGLALNCNTDLTWFDHIVPCGIPDKGVTSLSQQLSRDVSIAEIIPGFLDSFQTQFRCQLSHTYSSDVDKILDESMM